MNFEIKNYVMQIRRFISLNEYVMKTILIKDTPLCLCCLTAFLEVKMYNLLPCFMPPPFFLKHVTNANIMSYCLSLPRKIHKWMYSP